MHKICSFQTADDVSGVDLTGSIAAVIDILRATTTIVTACANGCQQIQPVKTVDEVFVLAKDQPDALAAGERGGIRVNGFDLGNSPREYRAQVVSNRKIILTTTNGTQALVNAESADEIVITAFLNLNTVADYLAEAKQNVAIIQAGTEGECTLEDAVCAGYLIRLLLQKQKWQLDETAQIALEYARKYQNVLDALHDSRHGQNLIRLGYADDLEICAQLNCFNIRPVYKGKIIQSR